MYNFNRRRPTRFRHHRRLPEELTNNLSRAHLSLYSHVFKPCFESGCETEPKVVGFDHSISLLQHLHEASVTQCFTFNGFDMLRLCLHPGAP